ncbi:MAG: hypothetical protein ACNA7U_03105, partial [Candidatus Izemoplasmataceae bacterium]
LILFSLTILILTACRPDDIVQQTPPTFSHILVEDRSPVLDGEIDPYVVNKQDMIRVEVHLNNPSNFRINTVTINQTTYRTNRFDETSTNSMIVLYLSVGQITGLTEYTVQRIEYLDESDAVRGFNVTTENVYEVFVLKSLPTATIPSFSLHSEALQFEINLLDVDQVIIPASAQARLYLDGTLIDTRSLNRGVNSLVFEDLLSDETYELIVKVDYDLEDSQGVQTEYLLIDSQPYKTTAKTAPSSSILNVRVTENSITFNVSLNNPSNVLVEDGLKAVLLQNGDVIETKILNPNALNDITFGGLLNNNTYTIRILADFNLNDAIGLREDVLLSSSTAQTTAREIPELNAQVISVSQSRLVLSINASNLEAGGIVDLSTLTAVLYNDVTNVILTQANLLDGQLIFEVDNLLSNTFIRIEIEADYDLQDGQGVRRDTIFETVINTSQNIIPSGTISAMTLNQRSVTFTTSLANPSNTVVPNTFIAELYENDTLIETLILPTQGGTYTFEGINVYYEHAYTVKIYVDYDLRDGLGPVENVHLYTYTKTSAAAKAPVASITSIVEVSNGFQINYVVYDNDASITELYLKYGNETFVLDTEETMIVLTNLHNNQAYQFVLEAMFNLRDTSGNQTLTLYEMNYTTRALATPSVELSLTPNKDSLTFILAVTDTDLTGEVTSIELYLNNTLVESLDPLSLRTFTNLQSNTTYELRVTYAYNLNDNEGLRHITSTAEFTTLEKFLPSITVEEDSVTSESIMFDVIIDDLDNVGEITAINLYLGSTLVDSLTDLSERVFLNLLSNNTYTIEVVYTYDLNDGTGVKTLIESITAVTSAKALPSVDLAIENVNTESVMFTVDTVDLDNVGEITAINLYLGITLVDSLTDLSERVFSNLLSNNTYTIEVVYTYDLNDGQANQTIIRTVQFVAESKEVPTSSITDVIYDKGQVTFNVTTDDNDTTIVAGTLTAVLLKNGSVVSTELITSPMQSVTFIELLNNATYEIKIIANYDLNEGQIIEDATLAQVEINSLDLRPIITMTETRRKESMRIRVSYNDAYDVLTGNLVIRFYDESDNQVGSSFILSDELTIEFLELWSNHAYTVRISGTLDLEDGQGPQNVLVFEKTIQTLAKVRPNPTFGEISVSGSDINVEVSGFSDPDNVVVTDSVELILYEDGIEIDRITYIIGESSYTFTDVYNSSSEYTISIVGELDLNESTGNETVLFDSITFVISD